MHLSMPCMASKTFFLRNTSSMKGQWYVCCTKVVFNGAQAPMDKMKVEPGFETLASDLISVSILICARNGHIFQVDTVPRAAFGKGDFFSRE